MHKAWSRSSIVRGQREKPHSSATSNQHVAGPEFAKDYKSRLSRKQAHRPDMNTMFSAKSNEHLSMWVYTGSSGRVNSAMGCGREEWRCWMPAHRPREGTTAGHTSLRTPWLCTGLCALGMSDGLVVLSQKGTHS